MKCFKCGKEIPSKNDKSSISDASIYLNEVLCYEKAAKDPVSDPSL